MANKKQIGAIYKILALYEDVLNPDSVVTERDYLVYVKNLAIKYNGLDKTDIYAYLNGIHKEGMNVGKDQLKSIVFHLIDTIGKED